MADIFNPSVPGATVSPFPPELQQDAKALARRRAIADLLMSRAFTPPPNPTGPNGIPVPMSPFAALAPVAAALVGGLSQDKLDTSEKDLTARYSAGLDAAQKDMFAKAAAGDYAGASLAARPYPRLDHIAELIAARTLPQNAVHTTYGPQGEQPSVVNLNNPQSPPIPLGAPKPPTLTPVETADAAGQPQTSFVNREPPSGVLPDMPKPVKLMDVNLGGSNLLTNPYGPDRTLQHTIDPNRVPTNEDIEAAAQRIAAYHAPGYATAGGRAQPWQMQVMRRVDEIAAAKGQPYDSSVFPIVKAGEIEFNQKNAPIVRSFGTMIGHIEAARQLYKALDNPTDVQALNNARAFFQEQFGVAAPTNLAVAKQFIADESVKAVLSGPGALDDRKAMAAHIPIGSSTSQFNEGADTIIHFGVENMKNHLQQLKGMTKGKRAEEDFIQYLSPAARQAYFRYGGTDRRKGPQEGVAAPSAAPSTIPDASAIDAELKRRAAAGG